MELIPLSDIGQILLILILQDRNALDTISGNPVNEFDTDIAPGMVGSGNANHVDTVKGLEHQIIAGQNIETFAGRRASNVLVATAILYVDIEENLVIVIDRDNKHRILCH